MWVQVDFSSLRILRNQFKPKYTTYISEYTIFFFLAHHATAAASEGRVDFHQDFRVVLFDPWLNFGPEHQLCSFILTNDLQKLQGRYIYLYACTLLLQHNTLQKLRGFCLMKWPAS